MKTMFGVLFEGIIKKKSYHERELLEKARKKIPAREYCE